MKNKPDKKAMKEEYQIMYKKVLEFTETAGRGASQRSQTEETLSMVDKGKYPKKFAEVSWDLLSDIDSPFFCITCDVVIERYFTSSLHSCLISMDFLIGNQSFYDNL